MARYRYHGSHPFMSKARQQAVDRERYFLGNNQFVPHLFGHTDDVAVYLRKRARDRAHTIAREQQYMRTAKFGTFKMNKYRSSMTYHPSKYRTKKSIMFNKLRNASKYLRR